MMLNLGGTVRENDALKTLEKIKKLLPLFGITRVMAQEGLVGTKIPVSIAIRPNGKLLSSSQGKGITRELADISAIMESIEAFHAERIKEPDLFISVSEIRKTGLRFIDPILLSKRTEASLYNENEPIGWLELKNLTDHLPVFVPRAWLDLNRAQVPNEISTLSLESSTNGLASGNSTIEAVIHALYELIERHCTVEYNSKDTEYKRSRLLDLSSLTNLPMIQMLISKIEESGLRLSVQAMHLEFGIPVFKAHLTENSSLQNTYGYDGIGAHYIPEVALSRAITEAVQSQVTIVTGSRDDIFPWQYLQYDPLFLKYFPPRDIDSNCPFNWNDIPVPPAFSNFSSVLSWTLDLLRKHGINDVCFYNHQKKEYGDIAVVTVVSTGLLNNRNVFYSNE